MVGAAASRELAKHQASPICVAQASKAGAHCACRGIAQLHGLPVQGFRAAWVELYVGRARKQLAV